MRHGRGEVALIRNGLDKLSRRCVRKKEPLVTVMAVMMESRTYIPLQIIVSHVPSHAEEVPEHTQHDVIAKDDDLPPEELLDGRGCSPDGYLGFWRVGGL